MTTATEAGSAGTAGSAGSAGSTGMHALNPDELQGYQADGYLVRRGVIPEATLAGVRSVFEELVDRLAHRWLGEGFVTSTYDDLPFEKRFAALRTELPARFPTSWRKGLVSPEVFQLWQLPELLGPIRSLVGDEVYAHGVWNGRPREPGVMLQKILWHQDAHYYKRWDAADGPLVSVWLPLVPVDEHNGCLQMLPGSHRQGYIERHTGFNGLFTVDDAVIAAHTPVSLAMQPGDALFFSDTTVHQSLDNQSDGVRWSIDIRFGAATEGIMSKTPRGYRCFSATDPTSVESYDTWVSRYNYDEVGLEAELETDSGLRNADLTAIAEALKTSRSELELF
jgi:hypothetical protein